MIPLSNIARSIRELGEIKVNEWDFQGLMNTNLNDLEITRPLRRLGNRKVMEWDFKEAMPSVHRIATTEVDVAGWLKRAANFNVLEFCFPRTQEPIADVASRLESFVRYVLSELLPPSRPPAVEIREIADRVIRIRVILCLKDQAALVGKRGETAAALRGLLKATAADADAIALLEILTPEEERRHRV